MYSKSVVGHGFHPHSSYRQPALNLRPVHQIVSHGHHLAPVNVSSFPTSINSLPIYRQVNPNYSLQLSLNQLESDLNPSDSSGNEIRSPVEQPSLPNGNHKERQSRSRVANEQHVNHHQATGSKSLVRAASSAANGTSTESTSLMNSRSTGAVLDYIQKERRAHTMAPMARILGPSSEPRANLFASVIAPSDAQMIKTQPRHQTATEPSNNTYPQSNGTSDEPITNRHNHQREDGNATAEDQDDLEEDQHERHEDDDEEGEEVEDEEEDVPIVVKVRYDPETGAPPSEDAIREAVDQQLRQRAGKRPTDGILLIDFSNGQSVTRSPAAPPLPIRPPPPQQPFNRSGLLPTSSNHQLALKPSGSFQNTNTTNAQLLQQEQQRRQQMLLQQQKQKFLLQQQQQQQQQRHQLLLLQQQKEKQQLEAFLQQQKQKALQQKILEQRLQQQQQEQQRLQQLRLKQQQEQQRLQQQKLQQEQQRLQQQRLQQQRLLQQQQQIKELQMQQQKQRQQALLQQQQSQKYREHMYQQQLQMSHIEEQRSQQNSLLPPIAPKITHIPPLPRASSYQRTLPTHSTSNTMHMPSQSSFPIAPVPILPSRRASSTSRKVNLAQSHSYSGLHSLSSYAPKYVPSLFIPINFELNNGRTSITVSHQNHTEIPNYLPPRPQTAPSSNEIYRPSSVTDIPELSQDSLRTMLGNIPDLHGRNFKIEYAPENIEDGYPIPINIDDRENRYTDAVIVDQLPNSIMQHVHNSNNPTLVAALSPSSTTDEFSKSTIPIHLREPYTRANISSVFVKHSMRQELLVQ